MAGDSFLTSHFTVYGMGREGKEMKLYRKERDGKGKRWTGTDV